MNNILYNNFKISHLQQYFNIISKERHKEVLLLLPLAKNNITSYLSPILGQYSIKTNEFLNLFIEMFNRQTQEFYASDFLQFLEGETSYLSEVNLIIPIHLIFIATDKYFIYFNMPTYSSLLAYFSLSNDNMLFLYQTFYFFSYNNILLKNKIFNLLLYYKFFRSYYLSNARVI